MHPRLLVALGMLALARYADAAPGSLDTGFGNGGKVLTSISADPLESPDYPPRSVATAIAMTRDGRILTGGYHHDGTPKDRFAFARFTAQGSLDTSFGSGGKIATSVEGVLAGMALASDGSIVALGADCKVARFSPTGSLDTQFGNVGVLRPEACVVASGIAVDAAGRILILGEYYREATRILAVMRFTAQGLVDTSFNSTGRADLGEFFAKGLAIAPSGKILALAVGYPAGSSIIVGRFNIDGSRDSTFGTAGLVETNVSVPVPGGPLGDAFDVGNAIAVDMHERVVVAGSAGLDLELPALVVIRYTSDGVLDKSFNGTGYSKGPAGGADGMAIQPDGKIVAVGSHFVAGVGGQFAAVRYLPNGALDAAFGTNGLVIVDFPGIAAAYGVVLGNLDLGGEILIAGSANTSGSSSSFALVALEGDDPPRMYGVSARAQALTGDDVIIGGFIIGGSAPKTVMVRARGPSLGLAGALADPTLTLVPAAGGALLVNDNWQDDVNAAMLAASGYQPSDPKESALMRELPPGAYTAIVAGVAGTTGVAIVEIYEIDSPDAPLIGISTRGRVQTGDNVMIGGFIIQGDGPQTVVVRARGPSLGVAGSLADPVLTLVPAAGGPVSTNDNWQTDPAAGALQSTGFAPSDPKESALMVSLSPGAYTAIVSGAGNSTGVAIVEVYKLGP